MIVNGYASTPDLDGHNHVVLPHAFSLKHTPPLLWRHRWDLVAGEVLTLEYRGDKLFCSARVKAGYADRAKGFSVGMTITEQVQRQGYIEVKRAVLGSISLVMNPCCPGALITHEYPEAASNDFHDLMIQRVQKLQGLVKCLQVPQN